MKTGDNPRSRRRAVAWILVLILLAVSASGLFVFLNNRIDPDEVEILPASTVTETNTEYRLWFPVGETLQYKLFWGNLLVGRMALSTAWKEHKGTSLLSITATAKTKSLVAKLYPVDDWVEVLVNPKTFLPVLYTQKLNEGGHRRHDVVRFDHAKGIAQHTDPTTGKHKAIDIKNNTRDVLSLAYFMRPADFGKGQIAEFQVLSDDQLYKLVLTGLGNDKVELPRFGKVDSLKVEPEASFGELFVRKGRVFLWFSDDKRRVCTQMKATVGVLKFSAILSRVSGPDSDLWPKNP